MTADFLRFGAESAKGGEIGYKGELFDRRLRVNSNVYYYEFSGLQRSSLDITTLTFTVRNAATAVTKGAEAEATFQATDQLSLRVSGAYNDAYYKSFPDAACYKTTVPSCLSRNVGANVVRYQDLSGASISRAPKFVLIAGFDYETPVTDRLVLKLNGSVRHSSSYLTQEDGNPAGRQPSYEKFDAGISLADRDAGWELSLQGRNLSNEYVVLYSANKPGGIAGDEIQGYVDRPREVALQFAYKF
jgi:outer membrane receptor protein involved in Fe transport